MTIVQRSTAIHCISPLHNVEHSGSGDEMGLEILGGGKGTFDPPPVLASTPCWYERLVLRCYCDASYVIPSHRLINRRYSLSTCFYDN